MTDLDKAVERLADEQDGLLHKTIKRLKGHVVAMSDGKKLVARGEPGPSPNPIMACLADLPEIVRHLEAAEFDIEAALEEHEAALSAKSAELAKAREALGSIARNTCCGTCREAALVARQALGETND